MKTVSEEDGSWVSYNEGFRTPALTNHAQLVLVCMLRKSDVRVQELCESRGGRPGLSVLTNLLVSVDVKQY